MPAASRKGDQGVPHCSGYVIAAGSSDVYINGIAAARQGDIVTGHLLPGLPCPAHAPPIAKGSRTIFVNNRPLARVGDPVAGCTFIAQCSPTVFAG